MSRSTHEVVRDLLGDRGVDTREAASVLFGHTMHHLFFSALAGVNDPIVRIKPEDVAGFIERVRATCGSWAGIPALIELIEAEHAANQLRRIGRAR